MIADEIAELKRLAEKSSIIAFYTHIGEQNGTVLPEVILRLLSSYERMETALRVVAKAELYDPATGIIDADVLEVVQETARAALEPPT